MSLKKYYINRCHEILRDPLYGNMADHTASFFKIDKTKYSPERNIFNPWYDKLEGLKNQSSFNEFSFIQLFEHILHQISLWRNLNETILKLIFPIENEFGGNFNIEVNPATPLWLSLIHFRRDSLPKASEPFFFNLKRLENINNLVLPFGRKIEVTNSIELEHKLYLFKLKGYPQAKIETELGITLSESNISHKIKHFCKIFGLPTP